MDVQKHAVIKHFNGLGDIWGQEEDITFAHGNICIPHFVIAALPGEHVEDSEERVAVREYRRVAEVPDNIYVGTFGDGEVGEEVFFTKERGMRDEREIENQEMRAPNIVLDLLHVSFFGFGVVFDLIKLFIYFFFFRVFQQRLKLFCITIHDSSLY